VAIQKRKKSKTQLLVQIFFQDKLKEEQIVTKGQKYKQKVIR
jgi:hypothetical protein